MWYQGKTNSLRQEEASILLWPSLQRQYIITPRLIITSSLSNIDLFKTKKKFNLKKFQHLTNMYLKYTLCCVIVIITTIVGIGAWFQQIWTIFSLLLQVDFFWIILCQRLHHRYGMNAWLWCVLVVDGRKGDVFLWAPEIQGVVGAQMATSRSVLWIFRVIWGLVSHSEI
jgi:hypothetical protein